MNSKIILATLVISVFVGGLYMIQSENSENFSLKTIQLGTRPTLYELYFCRLQECKAKRCDGSDKTCLAASLNYTKCYQQTQSCKDFDKEFETGNSHDRVGLDIYDCHNICRPEKSLAGNYWPLYTCYANCAGAGISTIWDHTACQRTTCFGLRCPEGDRACNEASNAYTKCKKNNVNCQITLDKIYGSHAQSHDPLPSEYYKCEKECRPAQGNYFYDKIYTCELQDCAGVLMD